MSDYASIRTAAQVQAAYANSTQNKTPLDDAQATQAASPAQTFSDMVSDAAADAVQTVRASAPWRPRRSTIP